MARTLNSRLFYFTIEDEGILAEAFSEFQDTFRVDRYLDIREPWLTRA